MRMNGLADKWIDGGQRLGNGLHSIIQQSKKPRSQFPLCASAPSRLCVGSSAPFERWQDDADSGSLIQLALQADVSPMLPDDAPGYGQTQTGPSGFGGEERLKQAARVLRRD